jgi:hypothetical protein
VSCATVRSPGFFHAAPPFANPPHPKPRGAVDGRGRIRAWRRRTGGAAARKKSPAERGQWTRPDWWNQLASIGLSGVCIAIYFSPPEKLIVPFPLVTAGLKVGVDVLVVLVVPVVLPELVVGLVGGLAGPA